MAEFERTVTRLLKSAREGQSGAMNELFPVIYTELHRRAEGHMRRERRDHTLQPTALVHEAYLRLAEAEGLDWKDRQHFFAVSSRVMRRVLVDHARSARAEKRGGEMDRVPLADHLLQASTADIDLIELDDALEKLESYGERMTRVVEMRFFGGLSIEEVADVLKVDSRTVKRDWRTARTILYDLMTGDNK